MTANVAHDEGVQVHCAQQQHVAEALQPLECLFRLLILNAGATT